MEEDDPFAIPDSSDSKSKKSEPKSIVTKQVQETKPEKRLDFQNAIDDIRQQMRQKAEKFADQLDDLKRKHAEDLSILKQENIATETATSEKLDMEYRNAVWSMTLKYVGRGVFTEELEPVLQSALNEEEFKLEKEFITMQQQNEEELVQVHGENAKRELITQTCRPTHSGLNAEEVARIIFEKLEEVPAVSDNNDGVIDEIIQILHREDNQLREQNDFSKPKKRKKGETAAKHTPKAPTCVTRSEKARKNMLESVAQADRFLKDLHQQEWFQDLFPHVE